MNVEALRLFAEILGAGRGLVVTRPLDDHIGTEALGLLDFHERRADRHDDGRWNAQPLGMIGQALGVIAGRRREDAAGAFAVTQQQQLVERAALLEGRGELLVFRLDPQIGAGHRRQALRKGAGRSDDVTVQSVGGGLDIGVGNAHGADKRCGKGLEKLVLTEPDRTWLLKNALPSKKHKPVASYLVSFEIKLTCCGIFSS